MSSFHHHQKSSKSARTSFCRFFVLKRLASSFFQNPLRFGRYVKQSQHRFTVLFGYPRLSRGLSLDSSRRMPSHLRMGSPLCEATEGISISMSDETWMSCLQVKARQTRSECDSVSENILTSISVGRWRRGEDVEEGRGSASSTCGITVSGRKRVVMRGVKQGKCVSVTDA